MTNSKVRNSDSAYSMWFSQVLLKLFTSLINTTDKEIHIFNSFSVPLILEYKPDKQTNTQQSSFNNKDDASTSTWVKILIFWYSVKC